ncbi:MAG: 2'-5' RNA ligase family protein [Pseudomonadota bacterium]
MAETNAPIIVSALFGDADFAFLNGLRREHFPPERNVIDAHLTLFHHMPPSMAGELKHRLNAETRGVPPPKARLSGLMSLGRGVAFRIDSPELEDIRENLADAFSGMLMPQDEQRWRPHVTIQNKVEPAEARRLLTALSEDFAPRPIQISGIACWYYRGGPWELLSRHMFAR